ncbi:hypothetical protein [Phaeobacter gallaeciensis]|uniref:hypothetical protein n=1 Tax=Phaeobacter gallaeciensis TaxID=60890 RepID=UPI00237EFBDE|nr:hypothetical protein [Phaeobacter gallaeciensis]MDE4191244.1 hypothetical protein [Phaeobacter gallaeciensis]MDE4199709.1 hypothetical protein [Phaeobacter gallaeciensis]MDE4203857.1 hypothetical protein [Phaeobacter gallaeciensis]MDE4207999.1 hypothetical protein [Phaeobacter gallaeciensis]MDE4216366.1 hypothetical protein [Phaeobacter gallaeciensis]
MFKIPKTKKEAVGFVGKALWLGSRLHLIAVALGVVGTIVVQLLFGFWDFRGGHQAIVREHYEETLAAHIEFQRQLERFNTVFEGASVQGYVSTDAPDQATSPIVNEIRHAASYSSAAQAYIRKINGVSRLLPGTEDELAEYVDAITALNRFYVAAETPEIGSVDGVIFYGEFRVALDRYIKTRDAYLEELAGEVGSYWRAVRNS